MKMNLHGTYLPFNVSFKCQIQTQFYQFHFTYQKVMRVESAVASSRRHTQINKRTHTHLNKFIQMD